MVEGASEPQLAHSAVEGGARLRYESSETHGTRLMEQWVRPPLHLAKAYHEEGWAVSVLTSPTAGLLQGDALNVDVQVEAGARVGLISPAACRVHTMSGGHATIHQRYRVEAGAILDVWPAPLILQKAASLRQSTELEVEPSSTVLLCEVVSPGRATFGERFDFTSWASSLRIHRSGQLLAYENFDCRPAEGGAADWRQLYPEGNYASLYCLSPEPMEGLVQTLHDLKLDRAMLGASPLREGGLGIKVLAADGICLRKAIFAVRKLLIPALKCSFPQALERAQTFFN